MKPRTSLSKFGGDSLHLFNSLLTDDSKKGHGMERKKKLHKYTYARAHKWTVRHADTNGKKLFHLGRGRGRAEKKASPQGIEIRKECKRHGSKNGRQSESEC